MDKTLIKELNKIVKLCRKLGIKTFKNEYFEFTLGELPYKQVTKRSAKQVVNELIGYQEQQSDNEVPEDKELIPSDILSEEAMLFWSTNTDPSRSES